MQSTANHIINFEESIGSDQYYGEVDTSMDSSLGFTNNLSNPHSETLFDTQGSWTQSTQDTGISFGSNGIDLPDGQHGVIGFDNRINQSQDPSWPQPNFEWNHVEMAHDALPRHANDEQVVELQPNDAQIAVLERYLQRWLAQNHEPTRVDIESIAHLEDLPADFVRTWFETRLRPHLTSAVAVSSVQPQPSVTPPHAPVGADLLLAVRTYAKGKFRESCYSAQAKKAPTDLRYKCTSHDCNYSTSERDAWQRHEQIWQPQSFWHCIVCRGLNRATKITSRKDKIRNHLRDMHGITRYNDVDRLRDDSMLDYTPGFERQCKFLSGGVACGYTFQSWEDRVQHYLDHFHGRVSDGPWQLRYGRHRWFDEDEDDLHQGGGTSSSGWSNAGVHSSGTSGSTQSASSSGRSHHKGARSHDHVVMHDILETDFQSASIQEIRRMTVLPANPPPTTVWPPDLCTLHSRKPRMLIDCASSCLVQPPINARYLALDHTWAGMDSARASAVFITKSNACEREDEHIEHLPQPLESALCLAKDFGYKYLWIAELCESFPRTRSLTGILESAALTITPVRPQQSSMQARHFFSHYKNLQLVHAWAEESMPFLHVQNLGHGAYGIVDEVRPPPLLDRGIHYDEVRLPSKLLSSHGELIRPHATLASRLDTPSLVRKELSTSRSRRTFSLAPLQEVEIMQKLDHPHIVRFIAAYYEHERRSLNILMTPVAQCNLRDFLSDPVRWEDRKDHLPRWYISLASALSYLHSMLVRHKDIKPANILVNGCNVLLSDFGASKAFSLHDTDLMAAP